MLDQLKRLRATLTVPAAEYVPAIGDALQLIDQMIAVCPDEQRAQAAQEDGPTEEQRILKRAVESIRLFHQPRDEALVLMGLARHAAAVDAAHTRGNATDDQLRDAWVTLEDAIRTALAGRQQ